MNARRWKRDQEVYTTATAGASTKSVADVASPDFASPTDVCDMVMKGGITSGIVYPPAILRIAQRFRLRSIGGTSAGAIAAAVAAAAEFRRATDRAAPGAGYMELKTGVLDWLAKGTNLQSLFVPTAASAPLYWLFLWIVSALSALRRLSLRGAFNLVLSAVVLGLGAYGLLALFFGSPGWPLFAAAKYAALLVVCVAAFALVSVVALLPRSNFGACTGGRAATLHELLRLRFEPLTFWLSRQIDTIAKTGEGRPLTFGDLWLGTLRADPDVSLEKPDEPAIDLAMVTTCLTLGRPFQLPFDTDIFYFRPDELERFFPPYVVTWMQARARKADPTNAEQLVRHAYLAQLGYLPLPAAADLPVVVATRMSLSFPILLSAIRLWTADRSLAINQADRTKPTLEPAWFSDGGLSSNFPIGIFDSPLPRWPTLGITLEEFPPGTDANDPSAGATVPNNNLPNIGASWVRFSPGTTPTNILGFIGAIVNAMQNWQDTMQSEAPGFRDRIAHVRLTSSEGGLNLTMPANLIERLLVRGERAGALLIDHFTEPVPPGVETTWQNHRRVRLRTTIDVAATYAERFDRAWSIPTGPAWTSYRDLLNGMVKGTKGYPYTSQARLAEAVRVAQQLDAVAGTVPAKDSVHVGAPKPPSDLRARPRF